MLLFRFIELIQPSLFTKVVARCFQQKLPLSFREIK